MWQLTTHNSKCILLIVKCLWYIDVSRSWMVVISVVHRMVILVVYLLKSKKICISNTKRICVSIQIWWWEKYTFSILICKRRYKREWVVFCEMWMKLQLFSIARLSPFFLLNSLCSSSLFVLKLTTSYHPSLSNLSLSAYSELSNDRFTSDRRWEFRKVKDYCLVLKTTSLLYICTLPSRTRGVRWIQKSSRDCKPHLCWNQWTCI